MDWINLAQDKKKWGGWWYCEYDNELSNSVKWGEVLD